jgi:CheY-like chemotaxis protein
MTLKGKVLIVEDNKTNQMLLSMILDDFGLEYEIANHGKEAVDMFHDNPPYDIILMDENMPIMNGIEAVEKIRRIEKKEQRKAVPIIAVTANALSGDRARFINAGMDDYIAKPYSEVTIKKMLVQYMP